MNNKFIFEGHQYNEYTCTKNDDDPYPNSIIYKGVKDQSGEVHVTKDIFKSFNKNTHNLYTCTPHHREVERAERKQKEEAERAERKQKEAAVAEEEEEAKQERERVRVRERIEREARRKKIMIYSIEVERARTQEVERRERERRAREREERRAREEEERRAREEEERRAREEERRAREEEEEARVEEERRARVRREREREERRAREEEEEARVEEERTAREEERRERERIARETRLFVERREREARVEEERRAREAEAWSANIRKSELTYRKITELYMTEMSTRGIPKDDEKHEFVISKVGHRVSVKWRFRSHLGTIGYPQEINKLTVLYDDGDVRTSYDLVKKEQPDLPDLPIEFENNRVTFIVNRFAGPAKILEKVITDKATRKQDEEKITAQSETNDTLVDTLVDKSTLSASEINIIKIEIDQEVTELWGEETNRPYAPPTNTGFVKRSWVAMSYSQYVKILLKTLELFYTKFKERMDMTDPDYYETTAIKMKDAIDSRLVASGINARATKIPLEIEFIMLNPLFWGDDFEDGWIKGIITFDDVANKYNIYSFIKEQTKLLGSFVVYYEESSSLYIDVSGNIQIKLGNPLKENEIKKYFTTEGLNTSRATLKLNLTSAELDSGLSSEDILHPHQIYRELHNTLLQSSNEAFKNEADFAWSNGTAWDYVRWDISKEWFIKTSRSDGYNDDVIDAGGLRTSVMVAIIKNIFFSEKDIRGVIASKEIEKDRYKNAYKEYCKINIDERQGHVDADHTPLLKNMDLEQLEQLNLKCKKQNTLKNIETFDQLTNSSILSTTEKLQYKVLHFPKEYCKNTKTKSECPEGEWNDMRGMKGCEVKPTVIQTACNTPNKWTTISKTAEILANSRRTSIREKIVFLGMKGIDIVDREKVKYNIYPFKKFFGSGPP